MGAIWFTAQTGNRYGRLDPTAGSIVLYNVPTANARPYGMDDAPDGHLWIALFGTNKLGEVDPANPSMLIEHVLPNAASRPRRLVVDKEGRVWYGDSPRAGRPCAMWPSTCSDGASGSRSAERVGWV